MTEYKETIYKYAIKIGNMYITTLDVDENSISNEFISKITLTHKISKYNEPIFINENEQDSYREKLNKILNLENSNDVINFERIEMEVN